MISYANNHYKLFIVRDIGHIEEIEEIRTDLTKATTGLLRRLVEGISRNNARIREVGDMQRGMVQHVMDIKQQIKLFKDMSLRSIPGRRSTYYNRI